MGAEVVNKLYSLPGKLLYSDITFVLSDGSEVEAHKLILALASPVFESEFYGGQWLEQTSNKLPIPDDMGVFREFISYIYTQKLDYTTVFDFKLWDLLYLANKYLVKPLEKLMGEAIKDCITNCIQKKTC